MEMGNILAAASPEVVYHCAAKAGIRESLEKPLLSAEVNALGSAYALEKSLRDGADKVHPQIHRRSSL